MSALTLWVIYDHPVDHPESFVVRPQEVVAGQVVPGVAHRLAETLEDARASLPDGLFCLGRMPDDDPVIVEVWV